MYILDIKPEADKIFKKLAKKERMSMKASICQVLQQITNC